MPEAISREKIQHNKELIVDILNQCTSEEEKKAIDNLLKTTYFTDPASVKYHSCFYGGLADHSLGLCQRLKQLVLLYEIPVTLQEIYRIGIMHDFCKIGCYSREKKNVKKDGKWTEEEVWVFHDDYPLGHSLKSIAVAEELGFKLSRREKLCIAHHMGPFGLSEKQCLDYRSAIESDPLIMLTHFADMIESQLGGSNLQV